MFYSTITKSGYVSVYLLTVSAGPCVLRIFTSTSRGRRVEPENEFYNGEKDNDQDATSRTT